MSRGTGVGSGGNPLLTGADYVTPGPVTFMEARGRNLDTTATTPVNQLFSPPDVRVKKTSAYRSLQIFYTPHTRVAGAIVWYGQ